MSTNSLEPFLLNRFPESTLTKAVAATDNSLGVRVVWLSSMIAASVSKGAITMNSDGSSELIKVHLCWRTVDLRASADACRARWDNIWKVISATSSWRQKQLSARNPTHLPALRHPGSICSLALSFLQRTTRSPIHTATTTRN